MLVYAVLCRCPWSIEISQNPSSNFRKLFFSLSLSLSDLVFTGHLVYFKILSVMWCERIVGLLQICCQKVCFPNGLGSFLKMKVKSSLWKGAWCHTLAKRWAVLGILLEISKWFFFGVVLIEISMNPYYSKKGANSCYFFFQNYKISVRYY